MKKNNYLAWFLNINLLLGLSHSIVSIVSIVSIFSIFSTLIFAADLDNKLTKLTGSGINLSNLSNLSNIELAKTPEEQSKGLMFRANLCVNCAMLFVYDQPVIGSFWMKNTIISLDMIFMNSTGNVVALHENTEPLNSIKHYGSEQAYQYVLETNAGFAKSNNISINTRIDIQDLLNKAK